MEIMGCGSGVDPVCNDLFVVSPGEGQVEAGKQPAQGPTFSIREHRYGGMPIGRHGYTSNLADYVDREFAALNQFRLKIIHSGI